MDPHPPHAQAATLITPELAAELDRIAPLALDEILVALGNQNQLVELNALMDVAIRRAPKVTPKRAAAIERLLLSGFPPHTTLAYTWIEASAQRSARCIDDLAASSIVHAVQLERSDEHIVEMLDCFARVGFDPFTPPVAHPPRDAPILLWIDTLDRTQIETVARLFGRRHDFLPVVVPGNAGAPSLEQRPLNLIDATLQRIAAASTNASLLKALTLIDGSKPTIARELADALGRYVEAINLANNTPTEKAVRALALLLAAGADLRYRPDLASRTFAGQRTLLHWLLSKTDDTLSLTALQHLLHSPACDVNAKDRNGDTALMFAVRERVVIAVEPLLAGGADMNLPNDTGHTALEYARNHEPATAQLLLAWSAKNAMNKVLRAPSPPASRAASSP